MLIDDLLSLARKGNKVSEQEPVELSVLIEECWNHVATEDVTLQTEIDRIIQADRSRLQQLLEI